VGDDKQGKVNILCMKWGDKYQAKYVNTLYHMVEKNLSKPFRFICLTDDDNGLITNIESFPIPEIRASLLGPERGWNKLSVFSSTLYDLEGDVLCLDLDLIIVGKTNEAKGLREIFFDHVIKGIYVFSLVFITPLHTKDINLTLFIITH
jgi:hypothetical protein